MEWAIVENTHDANREAMLMDLMQVRRTEYKFGRIEAMHIILTYINDQLRKNSISKYFFLPK